MFPSASPARAPRTLALVALLVVAVAAVALHTDAAAAAATGAGRLASRLALARPAAAAAAHSPTHAHAQAHADRRFQPKWVWSEKYTYDYPEGVRAEFPACTSEINGTTHAVISEDHWSRINFNPTSDDNSCRSDGGFVRDIDMDPFNNFARFYRPFCQAKCKAGYVNTAPAADQLTGGISKFYCDYTDGVAESINEAGRLSGGPQCSGPVVVGLAEGQPTAKSDWTLFHMELDGGLVATTADLVISVSCDSPGYSLSPGTTFTFPVGASRAPGDYTFLVGDDNGGSCTFTYISGDARFAGWTQTIHFVGPTLTASLAEGSTVLTGSVSSLVLTASSAVAGTLTTSVVRCADSADAEVGTLAVTSFSFANGDTAKALVYTMPSQLQLGVASITVTCKFTSAVSSDTRYSNFAIPDLVFTLARQSLAVSYNNEVINTNSPTTLTLTASAAPTTALTVTPTCSAGAVEPAAFVINSGASTATLTFTAPAVKTDVVCTFALATPSDVRFVGVPLSPLTIAVDVPIAVTIAAANPFINGVNPNMVKVLFSRSLKGSVTMLPDQALFPGKSVTAGTGSTSVVFQHDSKTAQPGDSTAQVVFTYADDSVDRRYVGTTATLAPRPIVAASAMTMTPSVATGSAALIAGRQSEMSVTLSYAAFDSLLVTPECKDGDTVVGSFSPSLVSFVDGATVASVNYTAPTSIVASLVCSFIRKSGDYRYYERSGSLAALQVIMPTIALTATVNGTALIGGDSLFVGDMVVLTVTVDPATNSALVLRSIRNGVAWADLTVDSGATTVQPGYPLMEAENSEWSFAYKSGDDRFAGLSSNSLAFSAVLTTLTASVINGSAAAASSVLPVTLTASHAVRDSDVVVHISCDGGAVPSGSFRVHVGATLSTVTEVTLPAAAATATTVTCSLWFDRGDARYSYSSAPSFFVVVPAAEPAAASSSSTGDSGSSTGTGTGTGTDAGTGSSTATGTGTGTVTSTGGASGSASSSSSSSSSGGDSRGTSSSTAKNECDEIECAATAQASSGFALLALAAAAAFALMH